MSRRSTLTLVLTLAIACEQQRGLHSKAPAIDATPAQLLFQPMPVGRSAAGIVEVRNLGSADLHFSATPAVTEADGDGLVEYTLPSVLDRSCEGGSRSDPKTLAPGDCAKVVVRYAPQSDGDLAVGSLKLETDDPDHPVVTVPLGLGEPAHLQVCTVQADGKDGTCSTADTAEPLVDFGLVAQGSNALKKVRLRNVGKSKLDAIAVYDPAGPAGAEFLRSQNAPVTLDPAASVDVTVKFVPAAKGVREAYLQIDSTDPLRPSTKVPLRGIAAGAALCADPSPTVFPATDVGKSSDRTLTLTSCGDAPVQLKATSFDALSSPAFTAPNGLPAPQTLQPGAKVDVVLRFRPEEASALSAAVLIPNDAVPEQYVELRGVGNTAPTCSLALSATRLNFGQVVKGQSTQRDVSVANRGLLPCSLTSVQIVLGGAAYSVLSAPSSAVTLKPGDTFAATVRYAPPLNDTNAVDNGTLRFSSDDPVHPQLDVALEGSPVASPECKVRVTPGASTMGRVLQFGNVIVSHTKTLPVTFTNIGSANCNIGNVHFAQTFGTCSASSCKDFKVTGMPVNPLAPGQSTRIDVTFAPTDTSGQPFIPEVYLYARTGDTFSSECTRTPLGNDNTAGCVAVGMSGQGDLSNLAILPGDLDFGLVTLGCRSKTQTISLYNTGTSATIAVKSITLDPATAPFYVTSQPTPFNIPPQGKVTLTVTYRPSQVGKETASLRIETDASNTTSQNPYVTVALTGTGTTDKHQRDTFSQAARPTVDMLFVVDNSGSMSQYQDSLAQQAPNFINEALSHNADYHIGVTTTAADSSDRTNTDSSYPGTTYYVGGLYGKPGIIDSSTSGAAGAFAKNVKVGTCCSDDRETGLEAGWKTLTPNANQTAAPQGSKDLIRDEARLVVVAVSDEEDQGHGSTSFYADFFKQVKGQYNAGLVSFNGIIGDPGSGCSKNGISAEAGTRYGDVVTATAGKWWSICSADWGQVAKDLALDAFQGRVQFALSRVADPQSIVVTMNGAAQVAGQDYTFDQPTNSIVFKHPPPPAATIVADYEALCL